MTVSSWDHMDTIHSNMGKIVKQPDQSRVQVVPHEDERDGNDKQQARTGVHLLGHQHVVADLSNDTKHEDGMDILGPLASISLDLAQTNGHGAKIVHIKDIRRFKLSMPLYPERASGPVHVAKKATTSQ
ncbi:hypothetical protein H310_07509 [Aphanomyces invadans]|uniref:Uncharacterized protein n=1 Tax=Aphanomyces invadans TaxID=157072 RepID=A0A024U393_9STRA|nr:hypothetical protein H310_07509 [Aphanomyces invadans]ETW00083.1 hypothetical protein H310_07509 [Aphanomyces invadans]|eukprot:XP_008871108.1 hypothetical protein H310_07509 [Aphanomyces invadans]